ncbi:hypothetical protein HYH02_012359 [Chlamydomonas schloesseri]|uniref:Guanylate cyclase domain-containing protein n=1 Tax=Chlamydomonas schloesseri TaxID=2026947 RepID=A0A835SZ16_9CHLO|nr:hypothetical protein HYH02_012359 [Chlamydomonas schloesseri]|eukprot:KAG2434341.1 hypothetical protein HYH02_012359 [Chlamydomonas schloesseri]
MQPVRVLRGLGLAAALAAGAAATDQQANADDALSVVAEGRWDNWTAAAAAGTAGGGAAGPAGQPISLSAVAVAETDMALLPMLRAHAAGNTSWLRQLNASAAAGAELPAELLTPPLGGTDGPAAAPLLLLYRRDWWQRLVEMWGLGGNSGDGSGSGGGSGNATFAEQLLPPTWDLLVRLLGVLRNSDLDGNGSADHVLCADLQPGCKGWAVLAAVYASVAQTQGTQQGMWFNATDLRPAVGGPAMQAALQTYAALAASNAAPFTPGGAAVSLSNVSVSPDELLQGGDGSGSSGGGPACGAVNPLFAAGRCLFTIDWATAALRLTRNRTLSGGLFGQLGAAPLPGSSSSYVVPPAPPPATPAAAQPSSPASADGGGSSSSGGASPGGGGGGSGVTALQQRPLRQCSAATCPHAREEVVAPTLQALLSAGGGNRDSNASPPQPTQPLPLLVNRAPLLGEASNVWVLAPDRTLLQLLRTSEFVRRVGFQLDLKLQLLRDDDATARLCQRELQNLALALASESPEALPHSAAGSGCAAAPPVIPTTTPPPPGAVAGVALTNGSAGGQPAAARPLAGSFAAAAAAATVGGLCGGLLPVLTGANLQVPGDVAGVATAAAATSQEAQQQRQAQAVEVLGLNPRDLTAVRQALLDALSHPNAALDIQLPYSSRYRQVLDDLAAAALNAAAAAATTATGAAATTTAATSAAGAKTAGGSSVRRLRQAADADADADEAARVASVVAELAANASQQFERLAQQAFPYSALIQRLYWNSIGFRPPNNNTAGGVPIAGGSRGNASSNSSSSSSSSGSAQSAALRIGLPVAVAVGGALALALLGVVCYLYVIAPRGARARSRRYRAAQPPGAGPATTLVMTDVQNSTLLWEVLPQDVMDHCLSLHHHVMREAIAANAGHEVFTEGDAFAVCFHGPDDALGFALDVQMALLEQPWPRELLQQPDAAEVWVMRRSPTTTTAAPAAAAPQQHQQQASTVAMPLAALSRLPSSLGRLGQQQHLQLHHLHSPDTAALPLPASTLPSPPAPTSAKLLIEGAIKGGRTATTAGPSSAGPTTSTADDLAAVVHPPQRSATTAQLLPPNAPSTSGASAAGSQWTTTIGGGSSTVSGTDRGSDGSRWSAVSAAVAAGATRPGGVARNSAAAASSAGGAAAGGKAGGPQDGGAARRRLVRWQSEPRRSTTWLSMMRQEREGREEQEEEGSGTAGGGGAPKGGGEKRQQSVSLTGGVVPYGGSGGGGGAGNAGDDDDDDILPPLPQQEGHQVATAAYCDDEAMPSPFVRAQQQQQQQQQVAAAAVRVATMARAAAAELGGTRQQPSNPLEDPAEAETAPTAAGPITSSGGARAAHQQGATPIAAQAEDAAASAGGAADLPLPGRAGGSAPAPSSASAAAAAPAHSDTLEAVRTASWRRRAARAAAVGAAAPPEAVIEEEGDEAAATATPQQEQEVGERKADRGSCFADAGVAAAVLQAAGTAAGRSAVPTATAAGLPSVSPGGSVREEHKSAEGTSGRASSGVMEVSAAAAKTSAGLSGHSSSGASSGQGRARGPKPSLLPAVEDTATDVDAEWQSLVTWDASLTPAAHVLMQQPVMMFSPAGHTAAPSGTAPAAAAGPTPPVGLPAVAPTAVAPSTSAFAGAGRALVAATRLAGQSGRRLLRSITPPQRATLPPQHQHQQQQQQQQHQQQQQQQQGHDPVAEGEAAAGVVDLLPEAPSLQRQASGYNQVDSLATAVSIPRPAATADGSVAAATAAVAGGLVGRISSLMMLAPARSIGAGGGGVGAPAHAAAPAGREGGGSGGLGGIVTIPTAAVSRLIHSDSGRRHQQAGQHQRLQGPQQPQQRSHFFRAVAPSEPGAGAGLLVDLSVSDAPAAVRRMQHVHMWAASAPPQEHLAGVAQGAALPLWGTLPQPVQLAQQQQPPQHQHQSSFKRLFAKLKSVRMPSLLRRGGSDSPHANPGMTPGSPTLLSEQQQQQQQQQQAFLGLPQLHYPGTEGQVLLSSAGGGRHQMPRASSPSPSPWNTLEQQVAVVAALRGGAGRRGGAPAGGAGASSALAGAVTAPVDATATAGRMAPGGVAAAAAAAAAVAITMGTGSPHLSNSGALNAIGGGGGGGNSGGGARPRASLEDINLAALRVGSRLGPEQRQQQEQLLLQLQLQQQLQHQQQQMHMHMLSPAGSVVERPHHHQHQLLPSSRPAVTATTTTGSGDGRSGRRGSPAPLATRASVDREQALLLTVLRLMRPDERRQQLAQLRQQAREASFSAGSRLPPRAASVTAGMPLAAGWPLGAGGGMLTDATGADLPLGPAADVESGLSPPLPRPLMVGPATIHLGSSERRRGVAHGHAGGSSHPPAIMQQAAEQAAGADVPGAATAPAGGDGVDEAPPGARDLVSVGDLLAAAASAAGGRSAIVPGLVSQFFASLWADINSAAHEAAAAVGLRGGGGGGGGGGAPLEERLPSGARMLPPSFGDSQTSTAASCGGGGSAAIASAAAAAAGIDASVEGAEGRASAGDGQRRPTSEQGGVSAPVPQGGASAAAPPAKAAGGGGVVGGGLISMAAATIADALRPLYERLRNEDVPALLQLHQNQLQSSTTLQQNGRWTLSGSEAGGGGGPGGGDRLSGSKTPRFMRRLSISPYMPGATTASVTAVAHGSGAGAGGQQHQHQHHQQQQQQGEPVLAFRGLRVRVGLHSGPRMHEVLTLVQDGIAAAAFTGDFLLAAKEVSDSAMGGMVVLSGSTFRALQQQLRSGTAGVVAECAMLLHLGEHVIKPPQLERDSESVIGRAAAAAASHANLPTAPNLPPATRELYAAVFPSLACRLALLPSPVRTHSELVPGCLSAPAGLVAPVFCNVVGVEALLAWEALVQERLMRAAAVASAAALAPCRPLEGPAGASMPGLPGAPMVAPMASALGFQGASGGSAMPFAGAAGGLSIFGLWPGQQQGMLMGSADCSGVGIVRAALEMFCDMAQEAASRHGGYVVASSADGAHWVLVFGCAEAAVGWGLDMLQAMLTAEWPDGFLEHELTEEAWEGGRLVKRGLRLRIGVDFGRAMVRLVPRSGRLDYVGRPMNRAARIAAKAKAASLLVSDAAWSAARPALGSSVAATNLGTMQLKGVKEQLELWALRASDGRGDGEQEAQDDLGEK